MHLDAPRPKMPAPKPRVFRRTTDEAPTCNFTAIEYSAASSIECVARDTFFTRPESGLSLTCSLGVGLQVSVFGRPNQNQTILSVFQDPNPKALDYAEMTSLAADPRLFYIERVQEINTCEKLRTGLTTPQ